jgi:hypothetical protein
MATVTTALTNYPTHGGLITRLDADASTGSSGVGMTFTVPASGSYVIDSLTCTLAKSGSPTGNATSSVYAISGTPGSSAVPSGSALGTSGNLDVTTLTTSPVVYTFSYTGANRVSLTNSTTYIITVEYALGDAADYVAAYGAYLVSGQNYVNHPSKNPWNADATQMFAASVIVAYTASSILGISTSQGEGSINF